MKVFIMQTSTKSQKILWHHFFDVLSIWNRILTCLLDPSSRYSYEYIQLDFFNFVSPIRSGISDFKNRIVNSQSGISKTPIYYFSKKSFFSIFVPHIGRHFEFQKSDNKFAKWSRKLLYTIFKRNTKIYIFVRHFKFQISNSNKFVISDL